MTNIVAVDNGGTFTNFVEIKNESVETWKILSAPEQPAQVVLTEIPTTCSFSWKRRHFTTDY
jgi:N-methylhydantoinase A/oxoprolinase/acetone carboxylase beta subunit